MGKTIVLLVTLLIGFSFLLGPVLAQEAANPQSGEAATITSSGSTVSSSMNSTSSMNTGGYKTTGYNGRSAKQLSTFGSTTPSGQSPLGGRDVCMGGASGSHSGSAASGMGSCVQ